MPVRVPRLPSADGGDRHLLAHLRQRQLLVEEGDDPLTNPVPVMQTQHLGKSTADDSDDWRT